MSESQPIPLKEINSWQTIFTTKICPRGPIFPNENFGPDDRNSQDQSSGGKSSMSLCI